MQAAILQNRPSRQSNIWVCINNDVKAALGNPLSTFENPQYNYGLCPALLYFTLPERWLGHLYDNQRYIAMVVIRHHDGRCAQLPRLKLVQAFTSSWTLRICGAPNFQAIMSEVFSPLNYNPFMKAAFVGLLNLMNLMDIWKYSCVPKKWLQTGSILPSESRSWTGTIAILPSWSSCTAPPLPQRILPQNARHAVDDEMATALWSMYQPAGRVE